MAYVEGFVIPVPAAKKDAFVAAARAVAKVFKEHGATRVVECWGDDVPDGKLTDFRSAVNAEEGEVVVFAWIEYPSKAARDAILAKTAADPRSRNVEMPFDRKRMIFGGFAPLIDE